jgi:hypothetical protein
MRFRSDTHCGQLTCSLRREAMAVTAPAERRHACSVVTSRGVGGFLNAKFTLLLALPWASAQIHPIAATCCCRLPLFANNTSGVNAPDNTMSIERSPGQKKKLRK